MIYKAVEFIILYTKFVESIDGLQGNSYNNIINCKNITILLCEWIFIGCIYYNEGMRQLVARII